MGRTLTCRVADRRSPRHLCQAGIRRVGNPVCRRRDVDRVASSNTKTKFNEEERRRISEVEEKMLMPMPMPMLKLDEADADADDDTVGLLLSIIMLGKYIYRY